MSRLLFPASLMFRQQEGGIRRASLGIDLAALDGAPTGEFVRLEVDLDQLDTASGESGHFAAYVARESFEGWVDFVVAEGDKPRIIFLTRPENSEGLQRHGLVPSTVGSSTPTLAEAGAESIRPGGGAAVDEAQGSRPAAALSSDGAP